MHIRYPRSFFVFLYGFADHVASRFSLPLSDALFRYTPVATALQYDQTTWQPFAEQLARAADPPTLIYQAFLERGDIIPPPAPDSTTFGPFPLFGCFYYAVSNGTTIHTHFLNNDLPGMRPLGSERADARRAELRRMFGHIRAAIPAATTVRGHSWLYNLPAYTRLFPPSYTQQLQENPDGVLNQVVLWYQCYDHFLRINAPVADEVLRRVDRLDDLADLRLCFPYQRLRTHAPITDFYAFYDIPGLF